MGASERSGCRRCGDCCRQGGPALHTPDRWLIDEGRIKWTHLITVRRGELAMAPLARRPEPVAREFLKLAGQSGSWCCRFFDQPSSSCTIYRHRPLACGLLECDNSDPILSLAGQDLLTRFDLIPADDPLLALMHAHEAQCPCPDMERPQRLRNDIESLTVLVNRDLDFRRRAAAIRPLSVAEEIFYFGRPLFQLLVVLGFRVRETGAGIQVE